MGFEETAGKKERLATFLEALEILDRLLRGLTVRIRIVRHLWMLVDSPPFLLGQLFGGFRVKTSPAALGAPRLFAPAFRLGVVTMVKDLAVGDGGIASVLKRLGQRRRVGYVLVRSGKISEKAISGWQNPRQHTGA